MATIEEGFKNAVTDFQKRLKPEEEAQFRFTSLNDLELAAKDIQEKQRKTKTARNLTRIQPFLQAMTEYTKVIEVFLNTSSILCFIWGPMKLMLLIASNWSTSFDILLDAYKQIAENFPLLNKYRSMFAENEHMKKVLVWIYEDILKFHLRALRVFSQPAWKQFFTATWTQFQESFKPILNDLLRHRELIENTANLEQIQESRDARLKSQASFAALEKEQGRVQTLAVVNWLSAAESSLDQEKFAETRLLIPATGQWILEEEKVKAWLDPKDSSVPIFWLSGIPGAGKTILASVIVEEAMKIKNLRLEKEMSIAYFYCRDQDGQRNKFSCVVKGILAQLLSQNSLLLPYLYAECLKKVTLETKHECVRILSTVLKANPKTFILLDGLDECEQKERNSVLNFFTTAITENATTPGKLRAFFVSQELKDIRNYLQIVDTLRLKETHLEKDIKSYAITWSHKIQLRFQNMPDAARENIVKLVCEGADGMFLFARLVLENLYGQENLESLYQELHPEIFPRGFEQAYGRIVQRIYNNPDIASQNTAKKLVGWIAFSKRPLKWHEIQGAESIDVSQGTVNFQLRQLPDNFRDICGSLVEFLPGNRVQLVHATARHYLIESKNLDICQEEAKLATMCLKYLTFECFDIKVTYDQRVAFLKEGSYAFLDYAILHWNHHLDAIAHLLQPMDLSHSSDLGMAINEFFETNEPGIVKPNKAHLDLVARCSTIKEADTFESFLLLLSYAREVRQAEGQLEALGALGITAVEIRAILQDLSVTQTIDPSMKVALTQFYGKNWFKCSRHACYYFHEGFISEGGLLQHTNRHEKPFCCTELGCTRQYIGWSTEKELKKHMSQYHPDPDALSWKFPHVKKPPTEYQCDLCQRKYTRASSLNTHKLREHAEDRPFVCKICGKGFVRKYECDRHETIHTDNMKEGAKPGRSSNVII